MGFYATESACDRPQETYLPPKNRVGGFSATSPTHARPFASQPVETHWENEPTPTTTASGVSFYGYRYYKPELGRWINRDPIGEEGGLNVYGFVQNRATIAYDHLGLSPCTLNETIDLVRGSAEWHVFVNSGNLNAGAAGSFKGEDIRISRPSESSRCGFLWRRVRLQYSLSDCKGQIIIVHGGGRTPEESLAHEMQHWAYYQEAHQAVSDAVNQYNDACVCRPCQGAIDSWLSAVTQMAVARMRRNDAALDCSDYQDGPRRIARCNDIATYHSQLIDAMSEEGSARSLVQSICQ